MLRAGTEWVALGLSGLLAAATVPLGPWSALGAGAAIALLGIARWRQARHRHSDAALAARLAAGGASTFVMFAPSRGGAKVFTRTVAGLRLYRCGKGRLAAVIAATGDPATDIASVCRVQAALHDVTGTLFSAGLAPHRTGACPKETRAAAAQALSVALRKEPGEIELAATADPAAEAATRIARALPDPIRSPLFEMWAEPLISADTGEVTALELLPRWRHPALGILTPRDMPSSGRSDQAQRELALRLVDEGIALLDTLQAEDIPGLPLILTLPANLPACERFVLRLAFALDRADLSPSRLWVRFEPTGTEEDDVDPDLVFGLVRLGCRPILDAVAAPCGVAAERVSIPSALTLGIDRDVSRRRLVSDILRLADEQDLPTLASGISRPEEATILAGLGCATLQGPAVVRAMPADRLPGWIGARASAAPLAGWARGL